MQVIRSTSRSTSRVQGEEEEEEKKKEEEEKKEKSKNPNQRFGKNIDFRSPTIIFEA